MIDKDDDLKTEEQFLDNSVIKDEQPDSVDASKLDNVENADLSNNTVDIASKKTENNTETNKPAKKQMQTKTKFIILVVVYVAINMGSVILSMMLGDPRIMKFGTIFGGIFLVMSLALYFTKKMYKSHQERVEHNRLIDERRAQKAAENQNESEEISATAKCPTRTNKSSKNKKRMTNAERTERRQFRIVFGCIIAPFPLIIIGGGIANYTPVGFWLLGLGVASFIGVILYFVIVNLYERKKYIKYMKIDKKLLKDFYDIKEGIVTKYTYHSTRSGKSNRKDYIGNLYQIWVFALNENNKDKYKTRKPGLDYKTQPRMLCHIPVQDGDRVIFYQNKTNPKDCWFIAKSNKM